MIKRWLMFLIPGLISLSTVGTLYVAPASSLDFMEQFYLRWAFLLKWVPLVILGMSVSLTLYFRSNRLSWLGLFFIALYGYLFHDFLGLETWLPLRNLTQPLGESLSIFPYLIPLQCLVIHVWGHVDPLRPEGMILLVALVGEFLGLPILFLIGGPFLLDGLSWLNGWVIPIGAIQTIPVLPVGLLMGLGVVLWWNVERSYYENGKAVLFWLAMVTTVPFLPGFEWYLVGDVPLHFFIGSGVTSFLLLGWTLNYAWSKAYRDQLTQIRGRMALDERLERLTGQYTLVMIDIDEFKSFNDTYGHDDGDKVLQNVAEILERHSGGQVYRFGGEEFTIVYAGRTVEDVEDELESIREAVANNKVKVTRKSQRATKVLEKRVTISLGAAEPTENLDHPEKVLNAADEAMFKAKEEGRNELKLANG